MVMDFILLVKKKLQNGIEKHYHTTKKFITLKKMETKKQLKMFLVILKKSLLQHITWLQKLALMKPCLWQKNLMIIQNNS